MTRAVAQVVLTPEGAEILRRGYPWLRRTEGIARWPEGLAPGELVDVVDGQKNPIAQAFSSTKSPIALRVVTRLAPSVRRVDDAFFAERLAASLKRRSTLSRRDAFRVVHGEADQLPGLFVDRYADALTLQTLSEGAHVRKAQFARVLKALTGARIVVNRDDASGRDFEGLARETGVLEGTGSTRVEFHEGDTAFDIELLSDSKTGSFLDQVDNHLRAAELGGGEALDAFSYHGGFALSLARTCTSVIAIEQDATAAERIRANAARNQRTNVTVENANAFDVLRRFYDAGRTFDTVVIDPPGLAKRQLGVESAKRAYHELNVRAMKLLKPEGLLVTCSCSGKVTRQMFDDQIARAAVDAKRPIQVLERRGAGIDHPVLSGLSETEYLKAWFVRVL